MNDLYQYKLKIISILYLLSIALIPVYTFSSGGFQVVDIPLIISIIISFFLPLDKISDLKFNRISLVIYSAWGVLINLIYSLVYSDINYIHVIFIMCYTPLIYFCFIKLYYILLYNHKYIIIYMALFISFLFAFITKPSFIEGGRIVLSFNDPNQLGYYSLLVCVQMILLSRIISIMNKDSIFNYVLNAIIFVVCHYMLLLSLSRSALAAFIVLDLVYLLSINNLKKLLSFVISIIIIFVYIFIINPSFLKERIEARSPAHFKKETLIESFVLRTAEPLQKMKFWQYIVGQGQGGISAIIDASHRHPIVAGIKKGIIEAHNIFAEIFRGYGLVGIILFLIWFISTINHIKSIQGLLILFAILIFNMGIYGLRFRYFWITMGMMVATEKIIKDNYER